MPKTIQIAFVAALLLAAASFSAQAASKTKKPGKGSARAAFNAGDNTLGLSIGVGSNWTYGSYSDVHSSPAVSLYYDHGMIDHVGPGTIGIGGVIGYQTAYSDYAGGYRAHWTNFITAARGTYHLKILKDKNNKFDPYGGVTVGFRSTSYIDNRPGNDVGNSFLSSTGVMGVFVGAKYNFMPHFGAFAELGYDISFLRIGAHLNF